MSRNRASTICHVARLGVEQVELAAGDGAGGDVGGGLDAVGHGLVGRTRGAAPRSTPVTTSVAVPMPSMRAPIFTRKSHRSMISGSRAALSIVVTPSASTAAVTRFSVAPTLGKSNVIVGTVQPLGRAPRGTPWANLNSAPIASRPCDVQVDRAGAEVVAARHRQPHVTASGEQRAEHVDRGPDPLDQLVRGHGREVARVGDHAGSRCRAATIRSPIAVSRSPMIATSTIAGTLLISNTPSASRLGRHQLEHRVLRARHDHLALQRADVAHRDAALGSRRHGTSMHPVTGRRVCPSATSSSVGSARARHHDGHEDVARRPLGARSAATYRATTW